MASKVISTSYELDFNDGSIIMEFKTLLELKAFIKNNLFKYITTQLLTIVERKVQISDTGYISSTTTELNSYDIF